jgi:chromosomal replication initiation ATPase DnaA
VLGYFGLLESRMSKKPSEIVQVKVRMREDLRRKIEHAAQKNGLTVNAEILRRLDQTFDVTLDKLEGSVAKLSRFESTIGEFLRERELAKREMLQATREKLQGPLTEREKKELQARREELERRLTEAEKKDQGDQS